ncbi:uncharacterized protein LOC127871358 [Dreissena polymorpha]|uniref:PDZ domain-containing protein n=1 Tax=Dreissena polymorpha TaxID=45954 RepID=A0A9D4LEV4_DREPO|nr:uncharacterized protein LOC127871358 [Dreissena polymorpha]KAH3857270.1 hypothetical protein DPMN_099876 [Dreissena polymorpha]
MSVRWVCTGILLISLFGRAAAAAANCPDAGVVVVASVFATLAVVFIVAGVVGFVLWRRRRGSPRPEKLKHETGSSATASPSGGAGDKFAYSNAAFDKDPEAIDGSSVDSLDGPLEKKGVGHGLGMKTWTSLPANDLPFARKRNSSVGSLDRNTHSGDENLVEVMLTSQDFIGLGFNIAGSMRDGIFVSQVHNRGPAKESGKFKVGDRILGVNISFQNMVYEDALTILSYASPYPVKVTLQKEPTLPKSRRLSEVRTHLNHPLYRSQSVEALATVSIETSSLKKEKRCNSVFDRPESAKVKRDARSFLDGDITEEPAMAFVGNGNSNNKKPAALSHVDADVHVQHSAHQQRLNIEREVSDFTETELPSASLELSNIKRKNAPFTVAETYEHTFQEDFTDGQFSSAFDNLTEEDKLDMLRLSYADPTAIPDSAFDTDVTTAEGEPKIIPQKPERKKKRSSSNSTASQSDFEMASGPSTPRHAIDDTIIAMEMHPPLESPPPPPSETPPPIPNALPPPLSFEDDAGGKDIDVDEVMVAVTKERSVSVNSSNINFEPVSELDVSNIEKTFKDINFSLDDDANITLVSARDETKNRDSALDTCVEEELISPTQKQVNQFSVPGFTDSSRISQRDATDGEMQDINEITNNATSSESKDNEIHFENSLQDLDMNLDMNFNFDVDSVIFKESFPNRNEREFDNGMAYDISVAELDAMSKKAKAEEISKSARKSGLGGIAFEVRDDIVTGETRTVNTNNIHRTVSYEIKSTKTKFREQEISSQRPTSLKTSTNAQSIQEIEGDGTLDWSGKRLVRAGSFTDIPQDKIDDWTNTQHLRADDAIIDARIQEDSRSPVLAKTSLDWLDSRNDEKNEFSDSDSQCRSISSSSSSDEAMTPRVKLDLTANGEDDGLGMSPDNSPGKHMPISDLKSNFLSSMTGQSGMERLVTVELNSQGDEDC